MSGRKGYNTCLLGLDMAIKKWNYSILHATFREGVADSENRRAQWRQRITPGDAAVQMTLDGLNDLMNMPLADAIEQFLRLFWDLRDYRCPEGSLEALRSRGFQIRLGARQPLSDAEKGIIQQALIDLTSNGGEQLGRYKHIANWIAAIRMRGTRTPTRVAVYIRQLVKIEHQAAVAAGKTQFAAPEMLHLTQDEAGGGDGADGDPTIDRWSDDDTETDDGSIMP